MAGAVLVRDDADRLIGLDALQIVVVEDEAGAGPELPELRQQFRVHLRQEVEHEHVGITDVDREEVRLGDIDQVRDAVSPGILLRRVGQRVAGAQIRLPVRHVTGATLVCADHSLGPAARRRSAASSS